MRITIDNLDGRGAVDYSASVTNDGPITTERKLNSPSLCSAELLPVQFGLPMPARRGRVIVTSDTGAVLFTGYLATEPVNVYAGQATTGPVYRIRISAVSDEWLLDRQGSGAPSYDGLALGLDAGGLIARLAERVQAGQAGAIQVGTAGTKLQSVGPFQADAGRPWTANAAAAAGAAYAGYRALNGEVLVQSAGSVTHELTDADGSLSLSSLQTTAVRELANDVTVSGAEEPDAYVAELFVGDGTTAQFELSAAAYKPAHRTLLYDSFSSSTLDPSQWSLADVGNHLSVTSSGLTVNGGAGQNGQTTLTALDAIEMGGSVVVQLSNVILGPASDGVIAGMYQGTAELANCFAGFSVRQSSSTTGGVTVIVPVLNGSEVGSSFTPVAGHSYTLRMRLHSVEMQRVMQQYYCMVDGEIAAFGGGPGISAPLDVVFDVVDEGVSSNTPATVLYDSAAGNGAIMPSPGTCAFVLVNATQMYGSIGTASVTQTGSVWVVSTLPNGTQQTRLIGVAGEGVDCRVSFGTAESNGKVTFFTGRVPVAGEQVTVRYRTERRSVARLANAASISEEAVGASTGTSRWIGKVLQPIARSSADCEKAAQAVLAFASSRTAAVAGSYACVNPASDIWPGDVLAVTSAGVTSSLLVRSVRLQDGASRPETIVYKISFANDWATEWADGLGLKLSDSIAPDVALPAIAAALPGGVLANLQQLTVTSLTSSALQIDAGLAPPQGGGFEVRRRDYAFGLGVDGADLVLRSPVRNFSIPRAAQIEEFYVRMYDGSTPPLYSRFSSAVVINAPFAS